MVKKFLVLAFVFAAALVGGTTVAPKPAEAGIYIGFGVGGGYYRPAGYHRYHYRPRYYYRPRARYVCRTAYRRVYVGYGYRGYWAVRPVRRCFYAY